MDCGDACVTGRKQPWTGRCLRVRLKAAAACGGACVTGRKQPWACGDVCVSEPAAGAYNGCKASGEFWKGKRCRRHRRQVEPRQLSGGRMKGDL